MSTTNSRPQGLGGASKAVGCRRVPGGYQFYDMMRGGWVAGIYVVEQADDQANSRYRDEVMSAIYKYGKGLGLWP